MIYEWRGDLKKKFNIETNTGLIEFYLWWLRWGHHNFKVSPNTGITFTRLENLFKIESDAFFVLFNEKIKLPQIFLSIYSLHSEFSKTYDLSMQDDLSRFIKWIINYGLVEYNLLLPFLNCYTKFHQFLDQINKEHSLSNLTCILNFQHLNKDKLGYAKITNILTSDLKHDQFTKNVFFEEPYKSIISAQSCKYECLSTYLHIIYDGRKEIKRQFALKEPNDVIKYYAWWIKWGHKEYAVKKEYGINFKLLADAIERRDTRKDPDVSEHTYYIISQFLNNDKFNELYLYKKSKKYTITTKFIELTYEGRIDIKNQFKLREPNDVIKYYAWWIKWGHKEYAVKKDYGINLELLADAIERRDTRKDSVVSQHIYIIVSELQNNEKFAKQYLYKKSDKYPIITKYIEFIYEGRIDLKSVYKLNKLNDSIRLLLWWLRWGEKKERTNLNCCVSSGKLEDLFKFESDEQYCVFNRWIRLPQIFLEISKFHPDIIAKYDFDKQIDIESYIKWLLKSGLDQYNLSWYFTNSGVEFLDLLKECSEYHNACNLRHLLYRDEKKCNCFRGSKKIQNNCFLEYQIGTIVSTVRKNQEIDAYLYEESIEYRWITNFHEIIYNVREDLINQYNLKDQNDVIEFYIWWLQSGYKEFGLSWDVGINEKSLNLLFSLDFTKKYILGEKIYYLPKIFQKIYELQDLKKEFDLDTKIGLYSYLQWLIQDGSDKFTLKEIFKKKYKLFHSRYKTQELKAEQNVNLENKLKSLLFNFQQKNINQDDFVGVNIVGLHQSIIGIGEDVRLINKSLNRTGIATKAIDIEENISIENQKLYNINLFCQPAPDIVISGIKLGDYFFENRINIASCPWELPNWPKSLEWIFEFFDKVWVHSEYVKNSIPEKHNQKIVKIPLPVSIDKTNNRSRIFFGLPEKCFLFLMVFDFSSWSQRKNPKGVLEAFKIAFNKEKYKDIYLVIKCINSEFKPNQFNEMIQMIDNDNRVIVIDKILDKPDLHDLFRNVDCFISLHRSEGFGRNIAEAMLLKTPVVVTRFSGNMDFTTQKNSFLINFRKKGLGPDDYIFPNGNHWAEPDLRHAAKVLKSILKMDKNKLEKKTDLAFKKINTIYSKKNLSKIILKLFKNIS
jgi:hypothetical protein